MTTNQPIEESIKRANQQIKAALNALHEETGFIPKSVNFDVVDMTRSNDIKKRVKVFSVDIDVSLNGEMG